MANRLEITGYLPTELSEEIGAKLFGDITPDVHYFHGIEIRENGALANPGKSNPTEQTDLLRFHYPIYYGIEYEANDPTKGMVGLIDVHERYYSFNLSDAGFTAATWKALIDSIQPSGGGGSGANLSYVVGATSGQVTSDTGTDAVIPAATVSTAGLISAADQVKLNGLTGTVSVGAGITGDGAAGTPINYDVNALTELATVDAANDFVLIYDASAGAHLKIRPNNLGVGGGTDENVKASAADPSAGYLDSKVANSVVVSGTSLQLDGDAAAPGNLFYYGTNALGVKGFYVLPTGGSLSSIAQTVPQQTSRQFDHSDGTNPAITVQMSTASVRTNNGFEGASVVQTTSNFEVGVDIDGQTGIATSIDLSADEFLIYDASLGRNVKAPGNALVMKAAAITDIDLTTPGSPVPADIVTFATANGYQNHLIYYAGSGSATVPDYVFHVDENLVAMRVEAPAGSGLFEYFPHPQIRITCSALGATGTLAGGTATVNLPGASDTIITSVGVRGASADATYAGGIMADGLVLTVNNMVNNGDTGAAGANDIAAPNVDAVNLSALVAPGSPTDALPFQYHAAVLQFFIIGLGGNSISVIANQIGSSYTEFITMFNF